MSSGPPAQFNGQGATREVREALGVMAGVLPGAACNSCMTRSGPGGCVSQIPTTTAGLEQTRLWSYCSMEQRRVCMTGCWHQLNDAAGSLKGLQGTSPGPRARVFTKHQNQLSRNGPLTGGFLCRTVCPSLSSFIQSQRRKCRGGVQREQRQPHPPLYSLHWGKGENFESGIEVLEKSTTKCLK